MIWVRPAAWVASSRGISSFRVLAVYCEMSAKPISVTGLPARSSIWKDCTLGTMIRSRITVITSSSSLRWRTTNSTGVPRSPRITETANCRLQPAVDSPSTNRMASPARMPAASAGEPRNVPVMTISSPSNCTVAPMPSKAPLMSSLDMRKVSSSI